MALAGTDGAQVEQLLNESRKQGAAVLADVTRRALKRWLDRGPAGLLTARRLFTDEERQDLIDALAATNATANLLGRSRIRLRLERGPTKFSDPFRAFDESGLEPLAPLDTLDYFRSKVPLPGVTADQLTEEMSRLAFTMALNTDEVVLGKVQAAISNVLATGATVSAMPRTITTILEAAGIQQTVGGRKVGGAYSEAVFRTNMMESYHAGAQQELEEVADDFPVWRYVAVSGPGGQGDGRNRPSHLAKHNQYYPSSVSFTSVRGTAAEDVIQCRCDFIPIYRSEWLELRKAGARIAPGYTDPVA